MISLLVWTVSALAQTTPRAVVDDHNAIACADGGATTSGDACPLTATGVGIAPLAAGPIKLATGPVTLRAGTEDEMCSHQRFIGSFDRSTTVDVGRAVGAIPANNSTYVKLIAEFAGVTNPRITQLFKVDLEGDGKDEVLFAIESDDLVYDSVGNASTYAMVAVRRISADGQVVTHTLFKDKTTFTAAQIQGGEITPVHRYGRIVGLTDLDGDKKLEIVVQDGFYEGATTTVFRVGESGAKALGATGCGA